MNASSKDLQADPDKISPQILWIYSRGKDVDTSNQFKTRRYIGNQFYVCTSGSVGFHSGRDFPKVWILAHDALHPQGGTLKISETAKFWSQLSVSLGISKSTWFVLFFFFGLDSFLRNKFPGKNGGGWGWGQGGIDQLVVQLCKISRLTSIVPESARKLWTAKIPNASCRPQLSSAKATTVKAWLHVTWINRDGICCAVFADFGLWTADSLGCFRMFRLPGSQQMDLVVANTIDSGANLLWFASP